MDHNIRAQALLLELKEAIGKALTENYLVMEKAARIRAEGYEPLITLEEAIHLEKIRVPAAPIVATPRVQNGLIAPGTFSQEDIAFLGRSLRIKFYGDTRPARQ